MLATSRHRLLNRRAYAAACWLLRLLLQHSRAASCAALLLLPGRHVSLLDRRRLARWLLAAAAACQLQQALGEVLYLSRVLSALLAQPAALLPGCCLLPPQPSNLPLQHLHLQHDSKMHDRAPEWQCL